MSPYGWIGWVGAGLGVVVGAGLVVAASCSKGTPPGAGVKVDSSAGAMTSALPTSANVVTIPAGKLIAGTSCIDHPRTAGEEMSGETIDMGEFSIDAFPYPNDPQQPAKTGVTRDDAAALCAARGRRLCTELEWERACKGPTNTMYEYGPRYDPKTCPSTISPKLALGSRPSCKSGFGVADMHGFVQEWTSSSWGRGSTELLGVLRGGMGDVPYVHARCSSARARSPLQAASNIGFRCCGGPENIATVSVDTKTKPALEPGPAVDAHWRRLLEGTFHHEIRTEPGVQIKLGRMWLWHPQPAEEIVVARMDGKGPSGDFVIPVIFHVCPKLTQPLARLRGPVSEMTEPQVDMAPTQLSIGVQRGEERGAAKFKYSFGQVVIEGEPAWVKPGWKVEESTDQEQQDGG